METRPEDPASLAGMDQIRAKEYILGFISTLKLTESKIRSLAEEESGWERRSALAMEKGNSELLQESEKERTTLISRRLTLENEAAGLRVTIDRLKAELRILPARERSIDPDLLEQELLILAGRMPGDEKTAARDRAFEKLENEAAADAALEALKTRMGR